MTVESPSRAEHLPELHPAALQGLAGDVVRAIAPSTEADPAGLLVTLLATVGAMIGDGPHVLAGGRQHPPRLWPLLVGPTGAGRKGTAEAEVERFVSSFDSFFVAARALSGLSTGEGLIALFRDHPSHEEQPAPPTDKRLLVVESEFARVLGVNKREGSTLSAVLRTAWESGSLHVLTRADPLTATGAHLVVVGHITARELRSKLADVDIASGFVNRFLPVLVHRSRLLPSEVDPPNTRLLAKAVGDRVTAARKIHRVRRDADAEQLWSTAYGVLCASSEDDGPVAEVLARGPAYVLRLALTYALLDGRSSIGLDHLRAGLAVWRYVAASARMIFSELAGDSDLKRLAGYLSDAPRGRTRTEIAALFSRNRTAAQLDALVSELERRGEATTETTPAERGRPTVRVFWTGAPTDEVGAVLGGEVYECTN